MNTRQIDLEERSHKEAVAKRRRELQEAKEKGYMSGGTTEGRQLFINLFLPYAEALRRRLNEAMSGKASKWAQFANHTHQLSEELGMNEENLRYALFGRNGVPERLVLRLQRLTNLKLITRAQAEAAFGAWCDHVFGI